MDKRGASVHGAAALETGVLLHTAVMMAMDAVYMQSLTAQRGDVLVSPVQGNATGRSLLQVMEVAASGLQHGSACEFGHAAVPERNHGQSLFCHIDRHIFCELHSSTKEVTWFCHLCKLFEDVLVHSNPGMQICNIRWRAINQAAWRRSPAAQWQLHLYAAVVQRPPVAGSIQSSCGIEGQL